MPKIVETMLDELVVKCPNSKAGCNWQAQRVNVRDHVMLYCEYTPVMCSAVDCRLPTTQKDFHKGCLHYTVSCEDCHTSLMKRDLEVSLVDNYAYAAATYYCRTGAPANFLRKSHHILHIVLG